MSTTAARTPSANSRCPTTPRVNASSACSAASSVSPAPRRTAANDTITARGDARRSTSDVSRAQSVPSTSSPARISRTLPAWNSETSVPAIPGPAVADTGGTAIPASTATPSSAMASASPAIASCGTRCVANPTQAASAPPSRAPVSAKYMPHAPRSWGRA